MELSEKSKKAIAKVATQYLKQAMTMHQEELANVHPSRKLSIQEYQNRIKKIEAKFYEIPEEGDDAELRKLYDRLYDEIDYFRDTYAYCITFQPEEIDELMSYIQESIEQFGFGEVGEFGAVMNGNCFIRNSLTTLDREMAQRQLDNEQEKKYKRPDKWFEIIGETDTIGFSTDANKNYIFEFKSKPLDNGVVFTVSSQEDDVNLNNSGVFRISPRIPICQVTADGEILLAEKKNHITPDIIEQAASKKVRIDEFKQATKTIKEQLLSKDENSLDDK